MASSASLTAADNPGQSKKLSLWQRFWHRTNERAGYLFIMPSLIHVIVFLFIPLGFSLYLSFTDWRGANMQNAPFVGIDNYTFMLNDRRFWASLTNSAYYTLLYVPSSMAVALFVAVILNRLKGSYFFRTLFFMPVISSWVAVSVVWITLLDPRAGILNYLLSLLGLPPVNWLGEPSNAMPTVVLISVWKNVGFLMVIWLAGLQAVPQELYEAAAIDGASRFQRFLYVTLPLLRPTTFFLTVTGIIGSFQVFSPVYVITSGGPRGATDVVVYRIYTRAFEGLDFGYASAQSWVLFLIIFGLTVVQFWYRRRNEEQVI